MDELPFCPGCGRQRGDDEQFCPKCGRAFAGAPVVPTVPTRNASSVQVAPQAILSLSTSQKPGWPWVLVAAGVLVGGYFALQAWSAYEVIRQIEASNAVTLAKGIDWLGRLFGASGVGQVVDPRSQQLYVSSQETLRTSLAMAGLGAGLALLGLFILATWQPQPLLATNSVSEPAASWLVGNRATAAEVQDSRRKILGGLAIIAVLFAVLWLLRIVTSGASVPPPSNPGSAAPPPLQLSNFDVPARGDTPFYVDMPRPGVIEGYFTVEGGAGDVEFTVLSPNGSAIVPTRRVAHWYDFHIVASESGRYTLLFGNRFSLLTKKSVSVNSRAY